MKKSGVNKINRLTKCIKYEFYFARFNCGWCESGCRKHKLHHLTMNGCRLTVYTTDKLSSNSKTAIKIRKGKSRKCRKCHQ